MRFLLVFLTTITIVHGLLIPFHPMSPRELHPESLKLCLNCKEAREDKKGSVCKLFGKTDPVMGSIFYETCRTARSNETLCGSAGRYFYHYSS
jgi:hypothetical protein